MSTRHMGYPEDPGPICAPDLPDGDAVTENPAEVNCPDCSAELQAMLSDEAAVELDYRFADEDLMDTRRDR